MPTKQLPGCLAVAGLPPVSSMWIGRLAGMQVANDREGSLTFARRDDQAAGITSCSRARYSLSLNAAFGARRLLSGDGVSISPAWRRAWAPSGVASPAAEEMETDMKRTFAILAAAAAVSGTLIASATPSLAQERGARWTTQQSYYGAGQYDRLVNGSDASTPGAD
jgi:hypothetical protein